MNVHRNQILNLLKLTIDNCEEGIVVKEPSSVYKPNARNAGWYKIKPEVRLQLCITENCECTRVVPKVVHNVL